MWFLLLMIFWLLQAPVLRPETPIVLDLAEQPGEVLYLGQPGEVISVSAHSLEDEPLDLTLAILLDDERLAFNDDHSGEDNDLAPQDAGIQDLVLDEAGRYQIRVANFNGLPTGRVELRLTGRPLVENCMAGEVVLRPNRVFACMLDLDAGQSLSVSARDSSNSLDPVLQLLKPDGTLLAFNDDHEGLDLSLNQLDAQLDGITIPETGRYRLEVRDFAGQAGTVALWIILS